MRKIIAIILTLTLLLGFGAITVQALPVDDVHPGIYLMIDANILDDYGLQVPPMFVPMLDDESVLDLTRRVFGPQVVLAGDFLMGFAWECGTSLMASDYAEWSGWLLTINNEMTMLGAAAEFPQPGDVIRWEFSLDFGVDIGFEGWDGTPPAITRADKSALIRAVVQGSECPAAPAFDFLAVLSNLTVVQPEVDAMVASLLAPCYCDTISNNDSNIWRTVLSVAAIVVLAAVNIFAIWRFVRVLGSV